MKKRNTPQRAKETLYALVFSLSFLSFTAPAQSAGNGSQTTASDVSPYRWSRSLPVNFQSPGIGVLGGTEARSLVPFDRKLFAGIGYWRDTQTANPALPGAYKYQVGFFVLSITIFATICEMLIRMYKMWPCPADLLNPFAAILSGLIFAPLLILLLRTAKWTYQNRYFTPQQFICRILSVFPV